MARIEEITALLTDEIEIFQKSVDKLAKESSNLKNLKLKVDARNVNQTLQDFIEKLNRDYKLQQDLSNIIQSKLTHRILIPKWIIVSFFLILGLLLMSIGYNIYQNKIMESEKNQSFNQGEYAVKEHINEFFNENPNSQKKYEKWKAK